jgi:hypothetical protein
VNDVERCKTPARRRSTGALVVSVLLSCGVALHAAPAHEGADPKEHHEGLSDDEIARQLIKRKIF